MDDALDAEWLAAVERDRDRCEYRDKRPSAPDGWSIAAQQAHPRYRYYLEDYAQCELREGHSGPHRNGGLIWHDPPIVVLERDLPTFRSVPS